MASYGNVAEELFAELGEAVLEHAPDRIARLVPLLPPNVNLLSTLAFKAVQAKQADHALALYERLLDLPIPDEGDGTYELSARDEQRVRPGACREGVRRRGADRGPCAALRAREPVHLSLGGVRLCGRR